MHSLRGNTIIPIMSSYPFGEDQLVVESHGPSARNVTYLTEEGDWDEEYILVVRHCMSKLREMVTPYFKVRISFEWRNGVGSEESDAIAMAIPETHYAMVHNGTLLSAFESKVLFRTLPANVVHDLRPDARVLLDRNVDWHALLECTESDGSKFDLCDTIMHEFLHIIWHSTFESYDVQHAANGQEGSAQVEVPTIREYTYFSRWEQFLAVYDPTAYAPNRFKPFSELVNDGNELYRALTDDKLVFVSSKKGPLAFIHSPPVYSETSSVVHISPKDTDLEYSLFYPDVGVGDPVREYNEKFKEMNEVFWDLEDEGAAGYKDNGENLEKFKK